MAVVLNKNSFCRLHIHPPFCINTNPSRESIFCGKVSGWWILRALIMLKILLKTRQNIIIFKHQNMGFTKKI